RELVCAEPAAGLRAPAEASRPVPDPRGSAVGTDVSRPAADPRGSAVGTDVSRPAAGLRAPAEASRPVPDPRASAVGTDVPRPAAGLRAPVEASRPAVGPRGSAVGADVPLPAADARTWAVGTGVPRPVAGSRAPDAGTDTAGTDPSRPAPGPPAPSRPTAVTGAPGRSEGSPGRPGPGGAPRPSTLRLIREDLHAVLDRDPSCAGRREALLHPGWQGLALYRLAHRRHVRGHRLRAALLTRLARLLTGMEIHAGARIGRRAFIDHGFGVVIGETAVVGADVTLYHGVTLGSRGWLRDGAGQGRRHPVVGDRVVIGTGASVLGPVTVADGCRVAAHALVLRDLTAP
ncbi:hypothetical protein AB0E00_11015, partial [Streptomyces sp. NPDC048110]|uniref:serine O-acetyltransferase n=1 Tax=Streptomyces sp. NPDC048110 TaxID=3155483 RepID=UPI003408B457